MNQFKKFQSAISVKKLSNSLFKITPDKDYFVGKTPHGGYLKAVMNNALISCLPHSISISSSIQYLDRTEAKEVFLEVDILKISRGSSSGFVKLIQDEKVCATLTGTCSDFEHMKGFDGLNTPLPNKRHNSCSLSIDIAVISAPSTLYDFIFSLIDILFKI